ncbi:hypothetical protein [Thiomicrorhabdus xiamenensis]|uniref:Uncharacterized protein n=1 Tax=Thiomicrorhabdus xiamenensis TaxID=2739063 RepID=A0A7D4P311_9GAMM|nr:hypothetical protein [Thiomicrorhabdus xiamenensis]QKI88296.1 hypothetical protein HQN79_01240 [Thiomicrorhabdus xiamenensis]
MRKNLPLMFAALAVTTGLNLPSLASASQESGSYNDPYTAGFENYAKENPALAAAIRAYIQDLKQAEQRKPELKETPEELGHGQQ